MTAAAHRITVCKLEYALDLVTVVDVSIKRSVAPIQTALLAEVHTARQLADTEEFGSVNKFPFERALVHQRREGLDRPEVGVEPELLAHCEQTLLRTYLGCRIVIVARVAHGPEEDCIRLEADLVG